MVVQNWSEEIILAALEDDPAFSDDLSAVIDQVEADSNLDVALYFSAVTLLNSSNIAELLKLRKMVSVKNGHRLKLCSISTHVWGVFLVTGLDKVFEFADDVATGLAGLQMSK